MDAHEIVDECFGKGGVPEKDQDYWPAIERWITETVSWMYIKVPGLDPFGDSEQRDQLLADSLALAEEIFEEKRREREEQENDANAPITIDQFIEQYQIGAKIQFIGRQTADNWTADAWKVTLTRKTPRRRMTVIFKMGTGHNGKPPTAAEVLDCVASDAATIENARNFEDFASELGYDEDSRSAERIYKACKRQTSKLERFIGDSDVYDLLLWNVERL